MKIEYRIEPYKSVGSSIFGMSREEIQNLSGLPLSTTKYGYPTEDKFLDDYGFIYMLSDNKGFLEAIEFYPGYTEDTIVLNYDGKEAVCSTDINRTIKEIRKITDDLVMDEENEGYISVRLGLTIYSPEDTVENILIHNKNYYDDQAL